MRNGVVARVVRCERAARVIDIRAASVRVRIAAETKVLAWLLRVLLAVLVELCNRVFIELGAPALRGERLALGCALILSGEASLTA